MSSTSTAELAVRAEAQVGEGPLWDSGVGRLLWVDLVPGILHRSDLATGSDETSVYGDNLSALALTRTEGLLGTTRYGFAEVDAAGLRPAERCLREGYRMNDAKCAPDGRFLAGSLRTDFGAGEGQLWSWLPGSRPALSRTGLSQPNGLAWSPDGSLFYLCDTVERTVTVSTYDVETGQIGTPDTLIRFERRDGQADGMCADSDGCLWIAMWGAGQIRRYAPDGRLLRRIDLPVSQPSCPAFVGGTALAVTSARAGLGADRLAVEPLAGSVFCVEVGVTGVVVGQLEGGH